MAGMTPQQMAYLRSIGMGGDGMTNGLAYQSLQPQTAPQQPSLSAVPSASTPGVGSTQPAPIQSFGATPSVTPTYVDPNQNQAYIQQFENLNAQSLQPTFASQDEQEQEQLAARGVTGGAAQYSTNQLAQGQGATLAGMNAPIVQQGYGNVQQDITGNANAANNATDINASYYANELGYNANTYNNYLSQLMNLGSGEENTLLSAYLNSFGPNTGVTSGMNTATGSLGNTFGQVASGAEQGQGAALGGLFGGAGAAIGGG